MLGDIPGIHHQQHLQRLADDVVELLWPPCLALNPGVVHIGRPHRSEERECGSTSEAAGGAAAKQGTGGNLPQARSKL